MRKLRQWTIPIGILAGWLAAAGYTVARLSWANDAWQMRLESEARAGTRMAGSVRSSSPLRLATHRSSGYGEP
jgi:hypothetical protein